MEFITEQLLAQICDAAREAGRIMLHAKRPHEGGSEESALGIEDKGGHANFVTLYDKKVQDYLERELHELLPEAMFIGEEDVQAPAAEQAAGEATEDGAAGAGGAGGSAGPRLTFVIDPIDGTSNFMKDLRASVVSIALLKDGAPEIGVVYQPYTDMMYYAVKGGGAFVHEGGNHPEGGVVTQQLRSSRDPLARSFVMIGTSPYYPEFAEPTFRLCAHYMPKCIDLRRFGAAAWEMCLAASGRTGLFLELHLQLWDYAAGALIAQEAGCKVTDIEGNPLRYTGPSSVAIASEGVSGEDYLEGTAEILAGIGKDRA